jgi:hypothetical protein
MTKFLYQIICVPKSIRMFLREQHLLGLTGGSSSGCKLLELFILDEILVQYIGV